MVNAVAASQKLKLSIDDVLKIWVAAKELKSSCHTVDNYVGCSQNYGPFWVRRYIRAPNV